MCECVGMCIQSGYKMLVVVRCVGSVCQAVIGPALGCYSVLQDDVSVLRGVFVLGGANVDMTIHTTQMVSQVSYTKTPSVAKRGAGRNRKRKE